MRRPKHFAEVVREFADRGDQWLLESPQNVRGLLLTLAGDLADRMDFSRMERLPTRFIPDTLRKHETDLLFRIPYRTADGTREVFIYILIEPQSRVDPSMGFRLLLYMVNIWDRQRRQWQEQKIPESQWRFLPIIPIVFYTGSQTWETPISIAALMDLPEELSEHIPAFKTLLLNLKQTAPEELTRSGHPFGWLLRVIQKENSSEAELRKALEEAVQNFDTMAEADRGAWEKAIYYLYLLVHHRRRPTEGERLKETIHAKVSSTRGRKRAEAMAQTLAEQLIEVGEKKGFDSGFGKGVVQAKQDVLLGQMADKFGSVPENVAKRVRSLEDTETLDRLLRRVLHAGNMEEMGF